MAEKFFETEDLYKLNDDDLFLVQGWPCDRSSHNWNLQRKTWGGPSSTIIKGEKLVKEASKKLTAKK